MLASGARLLESVFSRCPGCGVGHTRLCPICFAKLRRCAPPRGLIVLKDKPFVQKALYLWDEDDESAPFLKHLIVAAKARGPRDGTDRRLLRFWSEEFVAAALADRSVASMRGWSIVAPPGRSGLFELDHAGRLALTLSQQLGLRLETGLERDFHSLSSKKTVAQKFLSRSERANVEFRLAGSTERAPGYLFVDDVLATGSTAAAAWRAVGQPAAFSAWAIAHRPAACAAPAASLEE